MCLLVYTRVESNSISCQNISAFFTTYIYSTFASRYLDKLDPNQLDQYDELINRPSNDWQLYYWITGREETPTCFDNEVMDMLKEHSRNEKREVRLRQPDLTPSDMFAAAIPKPSI